MAAADRDLPSEAESRDLAYSAFISYAFADKKWAQWLHRQLERYRVPTHLRSIASPIMREDGRLLPVFRDRDELAASTDLAEAVKQALAVSGALVIICSPRSARSKWVNEEIREFRRLGRGDRIFCLIVDGQPGDPDLECFPPALTEDGSAEPLAADARPEQDGKSGATLKLLAALLSLDYDQLRRREQSRRMRRLTYIAIASTVGFLVTAGLAVTAYLARNEAIAQRNTAIERTMTAERTVDFVTGMFEVSDPSEALGSTITAREILDRASERYDQALRDEPNVRAQIGLTLSEVYAALGLLRQSDALIATVARIPVSDVATRARTQIAVGESRFRAAEYEQAVRVLEEAVQTARRNELARETLLARALFMLGQSHSSLDNYEAADRSLREALLLDERRGSDGRRDVARDLEGLALNEFYLGELPRAREFLERANRIRLAEEGPRSPSVSDNLNTLGSIFYMEGDRDRAIEMFRSRLEIDEQVLGPDHPDVGATLNNIGRIMVENRNFRQAEPILERAVELVRSQRGATHDDMAFIAANLAMAKAELGQADEAEALYRTALAAAVRHDHRNLAPIMTDLAALYCRRGEAARGLELLSGALPIMRREYEDEPWRIGWLRNVESECRWRAGDRERAERLLVQSAEAVSEKWDDDSYYGAHLQRRRRLVRS